MLGEGTQGFFGIPTIRTCPLALLKPRQMPSGFQQQEKWRGETLTGTSRCTAFHSLQH